MDFIEQWFGVSPDNGDGTLELLYVAAGIAIVATFAWRAWRRRRVQKRSAFDS
jgi:hypothetical protein